MTWRPSPRSIGCILAIPVVAGAILYAGGELYEGRDYLMWFRDRKSALVSVSESALRTDAERSLLRLALTDANGLEVEGYLRVPNTGREPHPALLVLGGVRTGKHTLEYLGDTGDWIVLALDYPYRGPRSALSRREFLAALPRMRRAVLNTIPAGMLAVDYLLRRPDVDPGRLVLAGGSFGALFSPALGAADERISAVAIFFGAGDLGALIDANLDLGWPLDPVATWLGSVIVSPLEPLKYVGRISPRPVFMLNGTEDPAMPLECSRALHDAAREPKTICWLQVGHVDVRSPEFHRRVIREFVTWLRTIGFVRPGESSSFTPAG